MDSHPVPKNVLDVEFKLFGALSTRQFVKVLIGALFALGIFLLEPIPMLLKLPLMVISVLTGVGAALIKGFEVRLTGILKAIFISPRYIWQKRGKVPDAFDKGSKRKLSTKKKTKTTPVKESVELTIDDYGIDQILAARATYSDQTMPSEAVSNGNFNRVYGEEFNQTLEQGLRSRENSQKPPVPTQTGRTLASTVSPSQQVQTSPGTSAPIKQLQNTAPRQLPPAQSKKVSKEEASKHKEEIKKLKEKLASLNKSDANETEKKEVLEKINELYNLLGGTPQKPPAPMAQGVLQPHGLNVFGVVVAKNGEPIPEAEVVLIDEDHNPISEITHSADDGKFAIQVPENAEEVIIDIKREGHSFHPFKIKTNSGRMPIFKFREH